MIDNPIIDISKINLVSIKTLKGSIEEIKFSTKKFFYSFENQTHVGYDKKHLRFILNTRIHLQENDKPGVEVAYYSIEFIFNIDNLEDFVDLKEVDNSAIVHPSMGITIAGIAYGTVRGIINVRTQGTILNGIILPIIDPANLIKPKIKGGTNEKKHKMTRTELAKNVRTNLSLKTRKAHHSKK